MNTTEVRSELLRVIEKALSEQAVYYGGRKPELPMFGPRRPVNKSGTELVGRVNDVRFKVTVQTWRGSDEIPQARPITP